MTPRRVVTLPPSVSGPAAIELASRLRARGADLLELRTDLHPSKSLDVRAIAAQLPILVAERGPKLPSDWILHATMVDRPLTATLVEGTSLLSQHFARPLNPDDALDSWPRSTPSNTAIKHVEPLGAPGAAHRLLRTQALLRARFGARVTVLATGPSALPFRCVLAEANALDYLASEGAWSAAEGQRLLADAVRAARAPTTTGRLGILGSGLRSSRSPQIHRAPFDRIDLPADCDLGDVLRASLPHYAGLAVTAPFKRAAAEAIGNSLPAVNCLVRRNGSWTGFNTDIAGAVQTLSQLPSGPLTVLGGGGASVAVQLAADTLNRRARVLRHSEASAAPVRGAVVWTWPPQIDAPPKLELSNAKVAVISYGFRSAAIARRIRDCGGEPVLLGRTWLMAQACEQRRLWETAS